MTLRKAQEFAERALGPRAPLGELKAAAVVRVRVPENLLAPREWRPPLRRAAGGAAQSAQHHQRCAQRPRVLRKMNEEKKIANAKKNGTPHNINIIAQSCVRERQSLWAGFYLLGTFSFVGLARASAGHRRAAGNAPRTTLE